MAADAPVMDSSVVVTETAATTTVNTTEAPKTPDTVVLHHFPRSQVVPDASPFGLKLETYLRMTKTKYENEFSKPQSSKTGKAPWLDFAGQDVSDSSMCIDFLKLKTGMDLNSGLTLMEKGISRAFQKMAEEELYWVLVLWRWSYDKEETIVKQFAFGKLKGLFMPKIIRSRLKSEAQGQGIGRLTAPEVMKIGEDDVTAIGEYLGNKKYFMGDLPTDIDCSLFGLLAQFLFASTTCPLTSFIKDKYPNIVDYCERMKAEFWPDWEAVCATATKPEKEHKKAGHSKSVTATETVAVMNGNGTVNGGHHEEPVISEPPVVVIPVNPEAIFEKNTTITVTTTNGHDSGEHVETVQQEVYRKETVNGGVGDVHTEAVPAS